MKAQPAVAHMVPATMRTRQLGAVAPDERRSTADQAATAGAERRGVVWKMPCMKLNTAVTSNQRPDDQERQGVDRRGEKLCATE